MYIITSKDNIVGITGIFRTHKEAEHVLNLYKGTWCFQDLIIKKITNHH